MNENVNVCITPKGEKPVLHFSQFDNENVFTVTVLADDGESAAVLTGLDIEFRIRKTDSHVVTIAPESVADNVITFKTTEQLCACCGQNIASVVLMKDDMVISTLDILVDIQRDILSGGLTSESDIRNLTTQIEQIVPEVLGDDYYTKTEVDELIDDIPTFDPTNYYDKSDVDDLLGDKADSDDVYTKSDVYNKTETDNLLADKANISDVYAKTEVNNLLSAKMDTIGYHGIVDDAAVISFTTDCNAPLDIIKGKITPVQSGSGTPSPQNVRPIIGFSALNVTRTGVNLLDSSTLQNLVSDYDYAEVGYRCRRIQLMPNTKYTVKTTSATAETSPIILINNKTAVNTSPFVDLRTTSSVQTYTTDATGCLYIGIYPNVSDATANARIANCNIEIVLGETEPTTFEPYNGQTATVNFGQTVYGGVADVTNGKVTITHIKITDFAQYYRDFFSGTYSTEYRITLPYPSTNVVYSVKRGSLCNCKNEESAYWGGNHTAEAGSTNDIFAINPLGEILAIYDADTTLTKEQFEAKYSGNIEFVYELATPIEITTTPETVLSIAGDNNIFLDTGNLTEIAYFEGAEDNLIKLIKACQI